MAVLGLAAPSVFQECHTVRKELHCFAQLHLRLPLLNHLLSSSLAFLFLHTRELLLIVLVSSLLITVFALVLMQELRRLSDLLHIFLADFSQLYVSVLGSELQSLDQAWC